MMLNRFVVVMGLVVGVGANSPAHAGVALDVMCKEAKARAAGKLAADIFKSYAKNQKKPNEIKLGACISKCESSFAKALARAESRGYCLTVADGGAIEAKVDTFIRQVFGVISPVCGDGVIAPGEECDTADDGACPGRCQANCTCTPCVTSGWPSCGGFCPSTQTCAYIGVGCGCILAGEAACGDSFPACDGACPSGQTCGTNGFLGCACGPAGYPACGDALAPTCDGACRPGLCCVGSQDMCSCLPGSGMRPCGSVESSPACIGACPSNAPICRDVEGDCTCTASPSRAFLREIGGRLD